MNFIPKVGNIHDWINFSGSILGGSITMIALIFTIMQENNNNMEVANTSNNIANKIKIVQQDTFSYNNLENVILSNNELYDQDYNRIYQFIRKRNI